MLSEKRQKEIEELNNSLAGFKPDKIFIEWGPARQVYVDSSFAEYKRERFALTGNEVYQIGYKLAGKLNHTTVYCMDAPGKYLFDTLIATGKKYDQYEHAEKYYNDMTAKICWKIPFKNYLQ